MSFRLLLAMMMSGTDQSGEIETHLYNNSNLVTDFQKIIVENSFFFAEKLISAQFLNFTYQEKIKTEAKEQRLEPLYRNTSWKSRLTRIKRDGHGHYDCGPNYFSVFPFFIFIQSFATTGAVSAKYLGF